MLRFARNDNDGSRNDRKRADSSGFALRMTEREGQTAQFFDKYIKV